MDDYNNYDDDDDDDDSDDVWFMIVKVKLLLLNDDFDHIISCERYDDTHVGLVLSRIKWHLKHFCYSCHI